MNINTQLNESAEAKLAYLQQMTHQNLEEILQQAIDVYYQQVQTQPKRYDFSDLVGKLNWRGDAIAEQRSLRNEW